MSKRPIEWDFPKKPRASRVRGDVVQPENVIRDLNGLRRYLNVPTTTHEVPGLRVAGKGITMYVILRGEEGSGAAARPVLFTEGNLIRTAEDYRLLSFTIGGKKDGTFGREAAHTFALPVSYDEVNAFMKEMIERLG